MELIMAFACRDIEERWAQYLYLEMDDPAQAQFVQHLQHCPQCSQEEARWRALFARLDVTATTDETLEVPSELVFRVKRQICLYEGWQEQTRKQIRSWAYKAASICILFAGGIWALMEYAPQVTEHGMLLEPLRKSVLSGVYTEKTLEIYRLAELFEETPAAQPNVAAVSTQTGSDQPVVSDSSL